MSLSLKIGWIHNQLRGWLLFFIRKSNKQHKKEGPTKNYDTMNFCPSTLCMLHLHLANSMELLSPSFYPIGGPFLALLDMHISEAFKAKFWVDFRAVTKATTWSHIAHLQWFLPIHVMGDLFHVTINTCKTSTLYVVNKPSPELFDSLMVKGWHQKVHMKGNIIRCIIVAEIVTFK